MATKNKGVKRKTEDVEHINPNKDICEMLVKLGQYERDVNGVQYKFISYMKASKALSSMDVRVKNGKEAQKLPGIGPKIAAKIDDFLKDGIIPDIIKSPKAVPDDSKPSSNLKSELPKLRILDHHETMLMTKRDALNLQVNQIETIDQLRNNSSDISIKLSNAQLRCVEFFADIIKVIPNSEVEAIVKRIMKSVAKLSYKGQQITSTLCGEYRRLKDSYRIDLLLTHTKLVSTKSDTNEILGKSIKELAERLTSKGLLTHCLSMTNDQLIGLVQFDQTTPKRKLHLRLIPNNFYIPAMIFCTGTTQFWTKLVEHALEMGFLLNEYGLHKIGATSVAGQLIPLNSEEELFEYIDHRFVPPEERS